MFTFLPDDYKKDAVKEYRLRLASVCLMLVCIFFVLGATLALPTFTLLRTEKAIAIAERDLILKNLNENPETLGKEISALNAKIKFIVETTDTHSMISILERVLTQSGNGISIQSLSLKRATAASTISIGGIASSRDSLVTFSKRLQGEPSFSRADVPVGSFAKNKDIPFNLSITSTF